MAFDSRAIDAVDHAILRVLSGNGRATFAEVGRQVGLTGPAVAERVGRLERSGVIAGYGARIDPAAVGYPVAAVVRVRPAVRELRRIPEIAAETPEVTSCLRITGEDCFLLHLRLRSLDDLEDVLDRFTPFGMTTTSIVHSAPVAPREVPL